jgi:two-component system KDP operon response regulator KdpE
MRKAAGTILIIDGDSGTRHAVSADLEPYGYQVSDAGTGKTGLNATVQGRPDLIILDPALPDICGVEILNRIRSWSDVPIIVLSSDTDESRKVYLLRNGADDYVTKPFGIAELVARCEAVLRRQRLTADKPPVVRTGPLTIDLLSHVVTLHGQCVALTRRELRLLHLLASHVGMVITHRQLIDGIWANAEPNNLQYLRTLMRKLRQKLEADPQQPMLLVSESGIGYRLQRHAAQCTYRAGVTVNGASHCCSSEEASY